jgi:tRNA (guanine37-N1)-methyltransferase
MFYIFQASSMPGILIAHKDMKKFDVITIFPEMIEDYSKISIIARAISKKLIRLKAINLRDFTNDFHQSVDGRPYGGGFGMVLRADILQKAIYKVAGKTKADRKKKSTRVILLSPQGREFTQAESKKLSKYEHLVFICGRYEGFDARISDMVDEEFSIGDYILMGGELPALVMIETIARNYPGVVGKFESTENESFSEAMLEYPQYTRPEVLKVGAKNSKVPKVLLSGKHAEINKWRKEQALAHTKKRRPDLLKDSSNE